MVSQCAHFSLSNLFSPSPLSLFSLLPLSPGHCSDSQSAFLTPVPFNILCTETTFIIPKSLIMPLLCSVTYANMTKRTVLFYVHRQMQGPFSSVVISSNNLFGFYNTKTTGPIFLFHAGSQRSHSLYLGHKTSSTPTTGPVILSCQENEVRYSPGYLVGRIYLLWYRSKYFMYVIKYYFSHTDWLYGLIFQGPMPHILFPIKILPMIFMQTKGRVVLI